MYSVLTSSSSSSIDCMKSVTNYVAVAVVVAVTALKIVSGLELTIVAFE